MNDALPEIRWGADGLAPVVVADASDGAVLAFFSHRTHSQTNLTTPDALLQSMASHFRDAVVSP